MRGSTALCAYPRATVLPFWAGGRRWQVIAQLGFEPGSCRSMPAGGTGSNVDAVAVGQTRALRERLGLGGRTRRPFSTTGTAPPHSRGGRPGIGWLC